MISSHTKTIKDILKKYLDPNDKIIKEEIKLLSQPGENFLSEIYTIDIMTENSRNNSEKLHHAVAKIVKPDCSSEMKEFCLSNFDKEIRFYGDILPTILQFRIENNIEQKYDIFPKLFGSKNNEYGASGAVDEHAVLVLENLKTKGYSNIDRTVGFDLEGAKLIVSDLAKFHGLTLALKLKKPEVYKTKIKKYCLQPKFPSDKTLKHVCSEQWLDVVLNQDKCTPYREQLKKKFDIEFERMDTFFKRPETEPWATLIHNDMWTNNTMQISENGTCVKNIFVDFQAYIYGSPLCDLVFFIWSSVQIKVIQEHSEELCQHYHRQLVSVLEEFGCDTTPFAYREFLKQLDKDAPHELLHILYLAALIYADKGTQAIDLSNEVTELMSGSISKGTAERIEFVVQDFGRRGWIVS